MGDAELRISVDIPELRHVRQTLGVLVGAIENLQSEVSNLATEIGSNAANVQATLDTELGQIHDALVELQGQVAQGQVDQAAVDGLVTQVAGLRTSVGDTFGALAAQASQLYETASAPTPEP